MIYIIIIWLLVSALFVLLPCSLDVDGHIYIDDEDVVWVTKNYTLNKIITNLFPHIAIMYDCLSEKINGDGLAILIILILLATLPMTIILMIIGAICLTICELWHHFCKKYARESDDE